MKNFTLNCKKIDLKSLKKHLKLKVFLEVRNTVERAMF